MLKFILSSCLAGVITFFGELYGNSIFLRKTISHQHIGMPEKGASNSSEGPEVVALLASPISTIDNGVEIKM